MIATMIVYVTTDHLSYLSCDRSIGVTVIGMIGMIDLCIYIGMIGLHMIIGRTLVDLWQNSGRTLVELW